jgi:hypothetical protein
MPIDLSEIVANVFRRHLRPKNVPDKESFLTRNITVVFLFLSATFFGRHLLRAKKSTIVTDSLSKEKKIQDNILYKKKIFDLLSATILRDVLRVNAV